MRGEWYETYLPEVASEEWFTDLEADEQAIVLESFKDIADDLTKKRVIPEYDLRLKRSKYLYRMLYGDEPGFRSRSGECGKANISWNRSFGACQETSGRRTHKVIGSRAGRGSRISIY